MNTPLSSNDIAKILIFFLLLSPTVFFFGTGIIVILFLIFGIFMMKKTKSFSHIETSVRNSIIFIALVSIVLVGVMLYYLLFDDYFFSSSRSSAEKFRHVMALIVALLMSFVYKYLLITFYYDPLKNHQQWVRINGIFSGNADLSKNKNVKAKTDGEAFFSVADEVAKLVKLKEDGHISEGEYQEAKRKLLDK